MLVDIYCDLLAAAHGRTPVVTGDSAGATLALALAQAVPDALPTPELVVLLSLKR